MDSATPYSPQPGDIGVCRIPGRVGLAIRAGQWLVGDGFANYEHAFVLTGAGRIVEAEVGGALDSPLDRYDAATVLWLRCPTALGPAVAAAALGYLGVPYSFLDYAAIGAHRFRLPAPGLRAYVGSTRHLICSQLADQAAADGGWHLFDDGRWPGYVTPGALRRLAAEQPAPA